MIEGITTCPACGSDLYDIMLTSYPARKAKKCLCCGWMKIEPLQEVARNRYAGATISPIESNVRLIDANKIPVHTQFSDDGEHCWDYINVHEFRNAPTVDAVPVIRCKECTVPHNEYTGCPRMNGTIMPPDGYCSFGTRDIEIDLGLRVRSD